MKRVVPFQLSVILIALLPACRGAADRTQDQPDSTKAVPEVKLEYKGPPVRTGLLLGKILNELNLEIEVPSGGYKLSLDETKADKPGSTVLVTLESPGEDEMVATMMDKRKLRVPLPSSELPVSVRVCQVIRGVSYVQQPPHELAAVLR